MAADERARVVARLPDSVLKEVDRPNAAARREEQRLILAAIAQAMTEADRATTQAARADAAELKLAEALAEIARLRAPR
jgi:hypothetical protein